MTRDAIVSDAYSLKIFDSGSSRPCSSGVVNTSPASRDSSMAAQTCGRSVDPDEIELRIDDPYSDTPDR